MAKITAKSKKEKFLKFLKSNSMKTVIFTVTVALCCFIYYKLSPYIISSKEPSDDKFPLTVYGVSTGELEIHFIDVGQGDAIYIKTPDEKSILIDAGENDYDKSDALMNYLYNAGMRKVDYMIATHSDADHIGGFVDILKSYTVDFVFRPYIKSSHEETDDLNDRFNPPDALYCATDIYADFINAVNDERSDWVFFTKDTDIIFEYDTGDKLVIDFMSPVQELSSLSYTDVNDCSPLLKITYKNFTAMFTGDMSSDVEAEMLDYYDEDELKCTVLKVSHHGSDSASSEDFIKAVSPTYAVISCGLNNVYNHPKTSVIKNLLASGAGTLIYRTDLDGTIVFKVNQSGEISRTPTSPSENFLTGYD